MFVHLLNITLTSMITHSGALPSSQKGFAVTSCRPPAMADSVGQGGADFAPTTLLAASRAWMAFASQPMGEKIGLGAALAAVLENEAASHC